MPLMPGYYRAFPTYRGPALTTPTIATTRVTRKVVATVKVAAKRISGPPAQPALSLHVVRSAIGKYTMRLAVVKQNPKNVFAGYTDKNDWLWHGICYARARFPIIAAASREPRENQKIV